MSARADSSDTKSTGAPSMSALALALALDDVRAAELETSDDDENLAPAVVADAPEPEPDPTAADTAAATRANCAAIAGGKSSVGAAKQKGDDSGSAMSAPLRPPPL